jgi:hypothetical protein
MLSESAKVEMANTINELRDSMRQVRDEISKIRREKNLTGGVQPTSPAISTPKFLPKFPHQKREQPSKQFSFDEKRVLSENINMLPPESLGKVVAIIQQRMPHLAQNSTEEIEIDLDILDAGTLRALEKYVKSVLVYETICNH